MFTWANRLMLATCHPCRDISKLKANKKDRYLSHEEVQHLMAACRGNLRDMVILALGTGMRASEVLSLDREHVDLRKTCHRPQVTHHNVVTLLKKKRTSHEL